MECVATAEDTVRQKLDDDRERRYRKALSAALAAQSAGSISGAVAAYRRAVAARPDGFEAHVNLASVLLNSGDARRGELHARIACTLAPDRFEPLVNHAAALLQLNRPEEAALRLENALALNPTSAEAALSLAQAYRETGETEKARAAFDRRLALGEEPGLRLQRDLLLPPVPQSLDAMNAARDRFEAAATAYADNPPKLADPVAEVGVTPFYLPYAGRDDRPVQETLARLYRGACPSLAVEAQHCRAGAPARPGDGRIRLGVVSAFFTAHTIGQLQRGLMVNLDKSRFALTIFLFAPPTSAIGKQIAAAADKVIILPRNLERARAQIAAAGLDILFYPDIGMDVLTNFLAHARLAPVQCTTWGHPITTGLPTMDYFVSSALMEPPENAAHYTEELALLDALTIYYQRPPKPSPRPLSHWGLPEDRHIYLCPQSLFKFHPGFDETFADVLRRDPDGLIVLVNSKVGHWGALLIDRLKAAAPDVADRIVLLPKQPYDDFLRLMQAAPVMLDSWPFGGGNTTLEALAMGTPVVTLPDSHLRGRLTLGFYRKMGVMDAVAESPADYAGIAVRLGTDPAARKSLSDRIENAAPALFEEKASIDEWERFFTEAHARASRA